MSDNKRGCAAAMIAAGVAALLLMGFVVMLGYRAMSAKNRMADEARAEMSQVAEAHQAAAQRYKEEMMEIPLDQLPKYELYERGEPLGLEAFVASRLDDGATQLAKEVFRENVEGNEVRWRLKTVNLFRNGDGVIGDFSVPYSAIQESSHSSKQGTINIRVEFADDVSRELLSLRRKDWVELEGVLSLEGSMISLLDARVVTAPVEAE